MTTAEKLAKIAENVPKVYEAGVASVKPILFDTHTFTVSPSFKGIDGYMSIDCEGRGTYSYFYNGDGEVVRSNVSSIEADDTYFTIYSDEGWYTETRVDLDFWVNQNGDEITDDRCRVIQFTDEITVSKEEYDVVRRLFECDVNSPVEIGYEAGYAKGVAEGGTAELETPTDSRTSMAYWYQYLADSVIRYEWNEEEYYDEFIQDVIPLLELPRGTQNITSFDRMFDVLYPDEGYFMQSTKLLVDEFAGTLDVTSATNLSFLFNGISTVKSVKLKGGANSTSFQAMFSYCSALEEIDGLITSNGTNFQAMFSGCLSLTEIGGIDTSNGTNFYSMFNGCSSLTEIDGIDTSKATNLSSMFYNCSALQTIGEINCLKATNMTNTFYGCTNLKRVGLKDIYTSFSLSSSPNLELDCLIDVIRELRDNNIYQTRTLTLGSANFAKLADVYVRRVDGGFEVCDSTDESAIPITTYATSKYWALKA